MRKLALSLLLISLLVGCEKRIETNCPDFPIPSKHVQEKLDKLAEEDPEIWVWGNQLLDLCQKLGQCDLDEKEEK